MSDEQRAEYVQAPQYARDIGWALYELRHGGKVRRAGWNGKGMFLVYVPGNKGIHFTEGSPYQVAGLSNGDIDPHIDMFTAKGTMQPGWLCSQADLLATDWETA